MNTKKYHHLPRIAATFVAITLPLSCLWAQTTTPPADVTITGVGTDVDFGWSVAAAGDINGDGITDLVVGDPSNSSVAQFAADHHHHAVIRVYDAVGNVIQTQESHRRLRLKFFENFTSQFP
jgi:FG-GAP repeat